MRCGRAWCDVGFLADRLSDNGSMLSGEDQPSNGGKKYPPSRDEFYARGDIFLVTGSALPDADAPVWGEVELVGWLDVEAGVPAVFVANGEGAVFGRGVRIG